MKKRALEVKDGAKKGAAKKQSIIRLALTIALAIVLLVVYRISLSFRFFPIVMWGYMIILTALVIVYIFYNRGFSRRGVTVDMLPDEWDEERKEQFVKSAERRQEGSKWMLMLIIAFLATFLLDAIELFILSNWFN